MGGERKHAPVKERETGSSIHLAFDELETMHLADNPFGQRFHAC